MPNPLRFDEDIFKRIDEDVTIFHYLEFWKFENMIKSGSLYFRRIDQYNDQLEGTWPIPDKATLAKWGMEDRPFPNREYSAASCWTRSDVESGKMWKDFTKGSDGVLIKSSHRKLRKSIEESGHAEAFLCELETKYCPFYAINSGAIKYIKHDSEPQISETEEGYITTIAIDGTKPYSLIQEKYINQIEYRVLMRFLEKRPKKKEEKQAKCNPLPEGFSLPVVLQYLIEEIRFHPKATSGDKEKINALLEGIDLSPSIRDSDLQR